MQLDNGLPEDGLLEYRLPEPLFLTLANYAGGGELNTQCTMLFDVSATVA